MTRNVFTFASDSVARLSVLRRLKALAGLLLVAAGVGAAVLGLRSSPSRVVEVIRDQSQDADTRLVTIRLKNWGAASCRINRFQARLRNQWTEPRDVFGIGTEVVCIVPAGADACRLLLQAQRLSLSERVDLLFDRCGLARRLPALCDWVASHLPRGRPAAKDLTVEIGLPGGAHKQRIDAMRKSAATFLSKAGQTHFKTG